MSETHPGFLGHPVDQPQPPKAGFFVDMASPFNLGWLDAYNRKPMKSPELEYVRGYNHGLTGKY